MIKNDDRETNVVSENEYLPVEIRVILLDSKKFSLSANSRTKKNFEPF